MHERPEERVEVDADLKRSPSVDARQLEGPSDGETKDLWLSGNSRLDRLVVAARVGVFVDARTSWMAQLPTTPRSSQSTFSGQRAVSVFVLFQVLLILASARDAFASGTMHAPGSSLFVLTHAARAVTYSSSASSSCAMSGA